MFRDDGNRFAAFARIRIALKLKYVRAFFFSAANGTGFPMFIFVVSRVFFGKRVLLFFDFMRCVVPANARVGSVSVVGIRVIVPPARLPLDFPHIRTRYTFCADFPFRCNQHS